MTSLVILVGLPLSACSPTSSSEEPPTPPTSTTNDDPAETPTTPTGEQSEAVTTPPVDTPPTADPHENEPPVVTPTFGGGSRELLLDDAFDPGDWKAGSYTPANEGTSVDAIAAAVRCHGYPAILEYRFAQASGKLSVDIAQDMRSPSSDTIIQFALEADGRQIQTKNIAFKQKESLETDLPGVTVLRISAQLAPSERCGGTANALITNIAIAQ